MIEDLEEFYIFVKRLKSTNSRLEKERILTSATEFDKAILEFLFNPYKPTGISDKKLKAVSLSNIVVQGEWLPLLSLLSYLTIHNTGSYADVRCALEVAYSSRYPKLVLSIVKKDLRLGVNATTLNKVFGKGFIPTFGVQLSQRYFDDPDKYVPEGTRFIITEKLDGVRCVLIFDDLGKPHFYARSGREFEGLIDLEAEAKRLNPSFVYDGELISETSGKSNDRYRETMSIVGSDGAKRGVVFNVFDLAEKCAFMQGEYDVNASVRKEMVAQELRSCLFIRSLPILYIGTDRSQILKYLNEFTARGAEGVMINIDAAPYVVGRTDGLLKVKRFKECEAVVRSVERGTGKNSNRLGAVIVDIKDEGGRLHSVRVGSGFTDEQRNDYFLHQDKVLDKVVEIGYFEVTHNKADDSLSLRFPTWLDRIRIDKEEEDMTSI